MKTKHRDAATTPGLPPAPAPTSRDANPWSMSATHAPGRSGTPAQATVPERPHRFPIKSPAAIERRRRPAFVPLVILAFIAMTAIGLLADAVESGSLEEAIGPLVALVFVAFMIFRQLRGRRS
jgi:hypothetical protein